MVGGRSNDEAKAVGGAEEESMMVMDLLQGGVVEQDGAQLNVCSYVKCRNPTKSPKFRKITEGCQVGGQDWSIVEGLVLCEACYSAFRSKGTLDRGAQPERIIQEEKKCCYEQCTSSKQDGTFVKIKQGCSVGGKEWRTLEGLVLCGACYGFFKNHGTLDRSAAASQKRALEEGMCSYEHCTCPTKSSKFTTVLEGYTAGGQIWSGLYGQTLCKACHNAFKKNGTLERAALASDRMSTEKRQCSYENCQNPTESTRFRKIGEGCRVGGQNWSSLVGQVLCESCYSAFRNKGKLERGVRPERLTPEEKKCSNAQCKSGHKGDDGQHFLRIKQGCTSGGRDWSSVEGQVLCVPCYGFFKNHGSLEKASKGQEEKSCSYEHCTSPVHSSKFYEIKEGYTAGGRDWTSLAGKVLCKACYMSFRNNGRLERAALPERLSMEEKRCSYEQCENPIGARVYFKIKEGCRAGGRDWESLVGSVFCGECYESYCKRGTLDRPRGKRQSSKEEESAGAKKRKKKMESIGSHSKEGDSMEDGGQNAPVKRGRKQVVGEQGVKEAGSEGDGGEGLLAIKRRKQRAVGEGTQEGDRKEDEGGGVSAQECEMQGGVVDQAGVVGLDGTGEGGGKGDVGEGLSAETCETGVGDECVSVSGVMHTTSKDDGHEMKEGEIKGDEIMSVSGGMHPTSKDDGHELREGGSTGGDGGGVPPKKRQKAAKNNGCRADGAVETATEDCQGKAAGGEDSVSVKSSGKGDGGGGAGENDRDGAVVEGVLSRRPASGNSEEL